MCYGPSDTLVAGWYMQIALIVGFVIVTVGSLAAFTWIVYELRKGYFEDIRAIMEHSAKTVEITSETVKSVFTPAIIQPPDQPKQFYDDDSDQEKRYYPDHEFDDFIPGS